VFGLSLFGAYEIMIPTGILNKLNAKSQSGDGIGSVILMGLTFSLASFSCTGPLVAAALGSASGGEFFYPIISMLAFSTVLAAPFFLLALFPALLAKMPKSGGWMNNLKVVMGFIVVSTSLYFINNALVQWEIEIFTREAFLAIFVATFLLISLYIIGVFKFELDSPVNHISTPRILFAMVFFTMTFYLFTGLFGNRLGELETFLPQTGSSLMINSSTVSGEKEVWYEDYQTALTEAKKQNKPLFIDFTGKSCTNCKKMDIKVFPDKEVQSRLSGMVKVKLYTDRAGNPQDMKNREFQQQKFNSIELPLYVILNPDESVVASKVATYDIKEFVKFLDMGVKK
jgi:thiol:disulfide interchange protein